MPTGKNKAGSKNKFNWLYFLLLVVIPFICFASIFSNEFINLDDGRFIANNKIIKDASFADIPKAFSEQYSSPHYKPLVYISWMIESILFGMDPFIFHFDNLLLHILNTLLVFKILQLLLTRLKVKEDNINLASFLGALLFSIHPFKVESVAWAVERKDVLFSLFFLLGLFYYLKYIRKNKEDRKMLYISMGCYVLTLLSKSMGITLLAVLFLVDYLYGRKFDKRIITEKIPYFISAILALFVYGMFTKYDKVTLGMTEGLLAEEQTVIQPANFDGLHPFYKQVLVMNYRLLGFIGHLFYPVKLAITYPRAYFLDQLGSFIHLLPLLSLAIIGIGIWLRKRAKWFAFGIGFYFVTIFPALVMGDKGTNFLPDRYMYIPSFGIFFIVLCTAFITVERRYQKMFKPAVSVLLLASLIYAAATFQYAKVWKDSITLWTDAIEKYPGMLEVAYKNRALQYRKTNQLENALQDYLILEKMQVKEAGVYGNIANVYGTYNQFDKSLEYYTKAIERDENYFNAYLNRGITFAQQKMFDQAFRDFEKAYSLDTSSAKLLESYAYASFEVSNFRQSINLYTELIEDLGYTEERVFFQRGLAYFNSGIFDKAVQDFLKTVSINPNNTDAIFNTSVAYFQLGVFDKALEYADLARQKGVNVSQDYYRQILQELGSAE